MAVPQLVAQLGGAVAEREAAYTELFRLEGAHYELASSPKSRRRREIADIAVACTIPGHSPGTVAGGWAADQAGGGGGMRVEE